MKRFALVGLSLFCLSLAPTAAQAEPQAEIAMSAKTATVLTNSAANNKITPFALVSLAYQGEYRTQGIPGFSSLQSAISTKKVTAKDLVEAAIEIKQLSPDISTNRAYINAVDLQLSNIYN
jgi:hypothetical protein